MAVLVNVWFRDPRNGKKDVKLDATAWPVTICWHVVTIASSLISSACSPCTEAKSFLPWLNTSGRSKRYHSDHGSSQKKQLQPSGHETSSVRKETKSWYFEILENIWCIYAETFRQFCGTMFSIKDSGTIYTCSPWISLDFVRSWLLAAWKTRCSRGFRWMNPSAWIHWPSFIHADPCSKSVLVGKSSLEVVEWPSPKVQFPSDWKRKSPHSWRDLYGSVPALYGFKTTLHDFSTRRKPHSMSLARSTIIYGKTIPAISSYHQLSEPKIPWGIQWFWAYHAYARSNSSQTTSFECSVASCLPRSSMPKAIEHYAAKHFL